VPPEVSNKFEAVCRARASAQKTPQTPGKTLIFEESADHAMIRRTPETSVFFRGFAAFSAHLHALRNQLKF